MAGDFSREWVSTLSDKADRAAKSQSAKDLRALRTAITKEINSMKSYRKYYEKTYGKAGTEYKSEEFQYLKKAQKQLLQVRDQIDNKIKDPQAHRVSYFKILNLEKEAKAKFRASIEADLKEQEETGKYVKVGEKIESYARQNVDKIFIDMFHNTKRTDFKALGEALKKADSVLNKVGISATDAVKDFLTDHYDEISSDLAYAAVRDVTDKLTEASERAEEKQYSESEISALNDAIEILRGVL